jgi:hypothetical protein
MDSNRHKSSGCAVVRSWPTGVRVSYGKDADVDAGCKLVRVNQSHQLW